MSELRAANLAESQNPGELLVQARTLVGHSALDIHRANVAAHFREQSLPESDKGLVGRIVEGYFGLPLSDRGATPDFQKCGVELKTVPVIWRAGRFQTEYRTVISQISYKGIQRENWEQASVRRKLSKILFVFYTHNPELSQSIVRESRLWEPGGVDMMVMGRDWWNAVRQISSGGELHEGDYTILGTPRKGAGGDRDLREVSVGGMRAPQRAFGFRPWFTNRIYHESIREAVASNTSQERARGEGQSTYSRLELTLTGALRRYRGRTIESIAHEIQVPLDARKDIVAHVLRQLANRELLDLEGVGVENAGIRLKTIGLATKSLAPIFDLSMSMVNLRQLHRQKWEETSLFTDLQRLFFIVTESAGRDALQIERKLGWAFAWTPRDDLMLSIRNEWELLRKLAAAGRLMYELPRGSSPRKRGFPTGTDTKFIHFRGKASTRNDTTDDPTGGQLTRQAYWLNKSLLGDIVREQGYVAIDGRTG